MSEVCVQGIDHLGSVSGMIEELGICKVLEEMLSTRSKDKKASHAKAVVAMILNGLEYVNKQLYLRPSFFKRPTEYLLGEGRMHFMSMG